jgi:hypothetical protein
MGLLLEEQLAKMAGKGMYTNFNEDVVKLSTWKSEKEIDLR